MPGAAGWRNDPAEFVNRTFGDPEFDPSTYLMLTARGEAEVTCEVDETNVASNALMAGFGARRVGGAVELLRPAVG